MQELGRCRNCKWWINPRYSDMGQCKLVDSENESVLPPSLAVAFGDYGYGGGLDTKPDFGCVQWETK